MDVDPGRRTSFPGEPRSRGTRGPVPGPRRVFAAVFPPPEAIRALQELRGRLEPQLPGLRWSAPGNLHYTLRFLGDRTEEEVQAAVGALDRVAALTRPFPLELGELNVFPNWRRPRVLWIGAESGSAVLEAFARMLEREFVGAGLGEADRPFVAHLTLGRWKDPRPGNFPAACRAAREAIETPVFEVREAAIIHSELGAGGSTYTPVHVAPFRG